MKNKKTVIQAGLSLAVLLLLAVFVWNLENLIREISFGPDYRAQVTTLDYYLEEGMYGELLREVRKQQTLGQETYLDRSEYEAFADYYEATLYEWMYSAGNGAGQADVEQSDDGQSDVGQADDGQTDVGQADDGQTDVSQPAVRRTEEELAEALEWREKREAAESRLTGYRFRKAVSILKEKRGESGVPALSETDSSPR